MSTAICPVVAGAAEPTPALTEHAPLPADEVVSCQEVPEVRTVGLPEVPGPDPVEPPDASDDDDPEGELSGGVEDTDDVDGDDDDGDTEEWVVVDGDVEGVPEVMTVEGTPDGASSEVVVVVDSSSAVPARVTPAFTG